MDISDTLLIGMIHLPRLQNSEISIPNLIKYALNEAKKLEDLGFSAILIENFNDTPFPKHTLPLEILIKISLICFELRKSVKLPLGLNLLRNACSQAMIVSTITNFDFIRCNVWEGAYVTDQGVIEGAAYEVMNIKNQLKSDVKVFADILVKHAKPLVEFNPQDAAQNAITRGKADRLIISGQKTGGEPSLDLVESLNQVGIKPLLGSGVHSGNISKFRHKISGAIVGTSIKVDKIVTNPISMDEGKIFVANWNEIME